MALGVVLSAVGLGALGDYLFQGHELGANAGIFVLSQATPSSVAISGVESFSYDGLGGNDVLMPAVDWRLDGGLTPSEVVGLARPLVSGGLVAGMDVTIYNPSLDTDDHAAGRVLLDVVAAILD